MSYCSYELHYLLPFDYILIFINDTDLILFYSTLVFIYKNIRK